MIKRIAVIWMVLFCWSCESVKYSFTTGSIPPTAKTVSVELFENMAPLANPNTTQIITDALRDKFQRETKLKLVGLNGDVAFRGTIIGYSTQPLAISGNETSALTRLTIVVNVSYENTIDDTQNFEQSFSRYADFDASQSLSAVEDALIREITVFLVQDIFNKAFLNW